MSLKGALGKWSKGWSIQLSLVLGLIVLGWWGSTVDWFPAYKVIDHVEIPSPYGAVVLDTVHIVGSAIAPNITQVLVRPHAQRFKLKEESIVLSLDGIKHVEAKWSGPRSVEIFYPDGPVYARKTMWNDVKIRYLGDPDYRGR